jgi:hypothetical protein
MDRPVCRPQKLIAACMSAEEYELYHYLNRTPGKFVSVYDIAKDLGGRRSFAASRDWATDCLSRLELEGLVEKNESGEYRIRHQPEDTTEFLRAIRSPGVSLGDTAIIRIDGLSP